MTRPATATYPSQEELLSAQSPFDWIDRNFLRCDPFAFRSSDFQAFALTCSDSLGVDPNGVFCIGSAAVGLSLNPGKILEGRLKQFDINSDLDVALISEVHFERAWRSLRSQAHPAIVGEMEQELVDAMGHQRKRFFDGAILANKLLPYLDFGAEWVTSMVRVSEVAARALDREIDVNCWIYRDYWSVRSYVANGMIKCREHLR